MVEATSFSLEYEGNARGTCLIEQRILAYEAIVTRRDQVSAFARHRRCLANQFPIADQTNLLLIQKLL